MAGLEARGWTVHTQIGVSASGSTSGIVHPDAPGATSPASSAMARPTTARPRPGTAIACASTC